jgi:hypothetical protein
MANGTTTNATTITKMTKEKNMMTKPRLCIECRHCIKPGTLLSVAEYSKCALTEKKRFNLVTGDEISDHSYCDLQRSSGVCGESGALWEALP